MKKTIAFILSLLMIIGTLAPVASASSIISDNFIEFNNEHSSNITELELNHTDKGTLIKLPANHDEYQLNSVNNTNNLEISNLPLNSKRKIVKINSNGLAFDLPDNMFLVAKKFSGKELARVPIKLPLPFKHEFTNLEGDYNIEIEHPTINVDIRAYIARTTVGDELNIEFLGLLNSAVKGEWFTNSTADIKDISFTYNLNGVEYNSYFEFPNSVKKSTTVLISDAESRVLPESYKGYERLNEPMIKAEDLRASKAEDYKIAKVSLYEHKKFGEILKGDKLKVKDNPDKWYFYDIIGSARSEGFTFQFREILKVKFNSGKGKFGENGPKAVTKPIEIGHSESLSARGISAPTDINAPIGEELVGWKANGSGDIIAPEDLGNYIVKNDTEFVAQYEPVSKIKVSVEVSPAEAAKVKNATIEVNGQKTIAQIKSKAKELIEKENPEYKLIGWGPAGDQPQVNEKVKINEIAYKSGENELLAHIVAIYKKYVVDTDPNDKDYIKITFKSDADEGKQDAGHFTVGEEQKQEINKWVLKGSPVTKLTAPEVKTNTGFKVAKEKWSPAYPTTGTFEEAKTFIAQYEKLEDVIVDKTPDTDDDRPAGYVTVKFLPGANGTLTGDTKYYVNPKANKTMADTPAPEVTANEGYKVANPKWAPAFKETDVITGDKEFTAQYKVITGKVIPYIPSDKDNPTDPDDKNIPTKDDEGNPINKDDYVIIGFNTDGNGKLIDSETGNKVDAISALVKKGSKWNEIQDYYPETVAKPDFRFDKWEPKLPNNEEEVVNGTIATAKFVEDRNIIPDPDNNLPKPGDNFVKVTFSLKANDAQAATLKGVKYFWVKIGTNFPLEEAPTIMPNEPYKVGNKSWDPMLPLVIENDTEIFAVLLKDAGTNPTEEDIVVPVKPVDPDKPFNPEDQDDENNDKKTNEGSVRIIFYADENGNFGEYKDSQTDPKAKIKKLAYDVKEGTAWATLVDYVPIITPNESYEVAYPNWKPEIPAYDKLVEEAEKEFHAQYIKSEEKPVDDVIPTTPEDKEDDDPNIPGEEPTHVLVTFLEGEHGKLSGTTMYWVKIGTEITEREAPTIIPNAGWREDGWDKDLPMEINSDTNFVAQYKEKTSDDVIPTTPEDKEVDDPNIPGEEPTHVLVTFLEGEHGKLSGTTMYWVKIGTELTTNMAPAIMPNDGYKVAPQKWTPRLPMVIMNDEIFTALYVKDDSTQPKPEKPEDDDPEYLQPFIPYEPTPSVPTIKPDYEMPVDEKEEKEEKHEILRHNLYIKGFIDGTFGPDKNITRAEVAMIFARIMNNYTINFESVDTKYSDVDANHWASGAIKFVSDLGIFKGMPDGSFAPQRNITRAEYATIIARYKNVLTGTPMFSDVAGHWAEQYIYACAETGIVTGYVDGTFKPNNFITRSEAVAMTNRMLDRKGDVQFILSHLDSEMIFPDITPSYWAFDHVYEASLTHEYYRNADNSETWVKIIESGRVR